MRGSFLIFGGNKKKRQEHMESLFSKAAFNTTNNPDYLSIQKEEGKRGIGISQIKKAIKWSQEKPYMSETKIIVIEEAMFLTIEAQNSLLKTLEEPADYMGIYLTTQSKNDVLDTILSRCKRIRLSNNLETNSTGLKEFLDKDKGEQFSWALEVGKEERDLVVETLEEWEKEARQLLLNNRSLGLAKLIELINQTKSDLKGTNVNQKLAVENFVMQI